MVRAVATEINEIFEFYRDVIEYMNVSGPVIGWRIDDYPNYDFVEKMVDAGNMFIVRDGKKLVSVAAVDHNVNPEYDDVDWVVKGPKAKIATVHALAVSPEYRGQNAAGAMLKDIEDYCRDKGDLAIHFDVIDFNDRAINMYMKNGYTNYGAIDMYYETVGCKKFNMLEKVL